MKIIINDLDITNLVVSIDLDTSLLDQSGTASLTILVSSNTFVLGSKIQVISDDLILFKGTLVSTSQTQNETLTLSAVDDIFYLKNKDTYLIKDMTASDVFVKVCKDFNINYKIDVPSNFKVAPKVYDSQNIYDIIKECLDFTIINENKQYVIVTINGLLTFTEINNLKTNYLLGDKQLLTSYTYDMSIQDDTYNQVKLVREVKEEKKEGEKKGKQEVVKREAVLINDSQNIQNWGLLQYYDKVDEKMNLAQMQEKATNLLKYYNKPTKTLSVDAIGKKELFAGCGIILDLKGIERGYYLITNCKHSFKNGEHKMSLNLEV